jgi:hypothetical protein
MELLVYKLIILKSIITFFYVFTFVILLSKILPQYEKSVYEEYSLNRIIYEIILETVLLFLILFTSKCLVNFIIKHTIPTKTKNSGDILFYISYSLIVSILFTTINKSYKNKILLLRDKLM